MLPEANPKAVLIVLRKEEVTLETCLLQLVKRVGEPRRSWKRQKQGRHVLHLSLYYLSSTLDCSDPCAQLPLDSLSLLANYASSEFSRDPYAASVVCLSNAKTSAAARAMHSPALHQGDPHAHLECPAHSIPAAVPGSIASFPTNACPVFSATSSHYCTSG